MSSCSDSEIDLEKAIGNIQRNTQTETIDLTMDSKIMEFFNDLKQRAIERSPEYLSTLEELIDQSSPFYLKFEEKSFGIKKIEEVLEDLESFIKFKHQKLAIQFNDCLIFQNNNTEDLFQRIIRSIVHLNL